MNNSYVAEFCAQLMAHYDANKRDMPWRRPGPGGAYDAYHIMVSEIMLQQTQVARVIPKYLTFIAQYATPSALAAAPLGDVLSLWQGLGYNRRAKYLWQAASVIVNDYGGTMPVAPEELVRLPGIGVNTAGAICTYAYNQPVVFIETNIRSVFIHHFFGTQDNVADKQIVPIVAEALSYWQQVSGYDLREYYWALMDYGTYLKSTQGNSARRSTAYAKQSAFEGSKRQVRGAILRGLSDGPLSVEQLQTIVPDERTMRVCEELIAEGLISWLGTKLRLG